MGFDLPEFPTRDGMYLRDAIGGQIKDTDEGKGQVLVTFPHDTVDTFKTTFDKEAFRESFQKRMPLMCWQHDLRDPIGHAIDAQVLPKSNDLIGQLDDFDSVPHAKRAWSQIHSGTITDFSFGFRQPRFEPHPRHRGVRNIRSAIMLEFSPVSVGSIPGAVATGLREEEFMSERSAETIARLVETQVISKEEGKRMLGEMEGYREHITIQSPEQNRLDALEAIIAGGGTGGIVTNTPILTAEQQRIADLEAQVRELRGETVEVPEGDVTVATLQEKVTSLEADLATSEGLREYTPPVVPEVINADAILSVLPEEWQRALEGAALAVAPAGTEFFRESDPNEVDENVALIVEAIDAALRSAADWVKDVDVTVLPQEVQEALQLFGAAGTSTRALMDVMAIEERAAVSPSSEPKDAIGSENMDPTAVKCDMCGGSGETEDGKTCPQCMGSGIEAVTRDDIPEDAPASAITCPTCKGTKMMRGGSMKCKRCNGKGWLAKDDVDDSNKRADVSSWSTKPWSDFKQSDYTPEQWKRACLIVKGDGSTKDQCSLPVKEPDGTYNVHGIAAAASRLNQVEADSGMRQDAAETLSDLYTRMKKDVPPEVAKMTQRSDEGEEQAPDPEEQRQAALARLDKRTVKA
jgi:HK97 family phage prohead protease